MVLLENYGKEDIFVYRFYQVIFCIGVMYTVATFFLGNLLDFDSDIDLDIDGELAWFTVSPLKPLIIISFMTVFGGVGMMGYHLYWIPVKIFIVAFLLAILTGIILYFCVLVPLYNAQTNSEAVKKHDLIGLEAEVMNAIIEDGYGKITYIANQNKYTGTAKSVNGERINQNQLVVIYKIEKNIFYVLPLNYKRGI